MIVLNICDECIPDSLNLIYNCLAVHCRGFVPLCLTALRNVSTFVNIHYD